MPDTDGDSRDDAYEYALSPLAPLHIAPRLYVDATSTVGSPDGLSWETAYPELRDALAEAVRRSELVVPPNLLDDVSEIWVARGVYSPWPCGDPPPGGYTSSRQVAFELLDHIGVYGGFVGGEDTRDQRNADPLANATVLSGDLCGDDEPELADGGWSEYS